MELFFESIRKIYDFSSLRGKKKYESIAEEICTFCELKYCVIYYRRRSNHLFNELASFPNKARTLPSSYEDIDEINSFDGLSYTQIYSGGNTLIGHIVCEIHSNHCQTYSDFLSVVSEIVSREIEADLVSKLFDEMTKQIPVSLSEQNFHRKLVRSLGLASGVPFAALRRYREEESIKKMECLAVYTKDISSEDEVPCDELAFYERDKIYDAFYSCMTDTPSQCRVYNDEQSMVLKELTSFRPFEKVKTIVVSPLLVGGKELGTVSFGILYKTKLSAFEKNAFLAVANWAGASLSNYEESRAYAEIERVKFQEFNNEVTIEITAGLRHAAKNNLETAINWLRAFGVTFSKLDASIKKKIQSLQEIILKAEESTFLAIKDVNNMAAVSKLKPAIKKEKNILELISKAKYFVEYRLGMAKIKVATAEISPRNQLKVDESQIVYALVNLFINSIEAFNRNFTKSNRFIKIKTRLISRDGKGQQMLIITFLDNAGGVREGNVPLADAQEVWKTGFTTRKNGSGMGLPYVRRVFQQQHDGNVYLSSDKIGTKIEIHLPVID